MFLTKKKTFPGKKKNKLKKPIILVFIPVMQLDKNNIHLLTNQA